jgi:hypothetical protein
LVVSVASRIDDAAYPVELAASPLTLDRSNDGQDHTVLPYAEFALRQRPAAWCTQPPRCQRDEPSAPFVSTLAIAHGVHPALQRTPRARRCRVHRNPARDQ